MENSERVLACEDSGASAMIANTPPAVRGWLRFGQSWRDFRFGDRENAGHTLELRDVQHRGTAVSTGAERVGHRRERPDISGYRVGVRKVHLGHRTIYV